MGRLKIGVLASGRGSNLQAILDAVNKGTLEVDVAVVVSDKSDAQALERARQNNVKAVYINPKDFESKEGYEQKIVEVLRENNIGVVVLAGYMRIVGKTILGAFRNKIINIHPALTPSFPGLHAQRRALEFGVKYSGCTVHFVDESVDEGPIILQAVVPVLADDTVDSLSERILAEEHKILPKAIKLYSENKLKVEGRKVKIL